LALYTEDMKDNLKPLLRHRVLIAACFQLVLVSSFSFTARLDCNRVTFGAEMAVNQEMPAGSRGFFFWATICLVIQMMLVGCGGAGTTGTIDGTTTGGGGGGNNGGGSGGGGGVQTFTKEGPDFNTLGGGPTEAYYDETRQLLYVSNPPLNEVDVLSGADLSVVTRISVPQPMGIDQLPDRKTLVVGSWTQGIYSIDQTTLAVTRHLCPNFSGLLTTTLLLTPISMANGKVLIIGKDEGMYTDDGYAGQRIIEWDSSTENFTLFFSAEGPIQYEINRLRRSGDHKWAIFAADKLYLYSSDSDTLLSTSAPYPSNAEPYSLRDVAANATGTQFAVSSAYQISFYDQELNFLGNTTDTQSGSYEYMNMQYSADGTRLYWGLYPLSGTASMVDVIDTTTFAELGDVTVKFGITPFPILMAVDSKQRAYISSASGVGIVDCTNLHSGPPYPSVGESFNPLSIPIDATASIAWNVTDPGFPPGTGVTFAGVPGSVVANSPNQLTVTPPPSSNSALVDMGVTLPDGESLIYPLLFSYGLKVAAATATLLPPTGNPTMEVFGSGLRMPSAPFTPPSVTVGTQSVLAAQVNTGLSNGNGVEGVFVRVPNGSPGPTNITATNGMGTGMLSNAVAYIPSATILPVNGLVQLIYDTHRNLIFALTHTEVDVLNPATLQWEAPLLPGGSKGISYISMTLRPDGSKMVVLDSSASTLTVFSPDSPSESTVISVPPSAVGQVPPTLAATNTGKVFIAHYNTTMEFDLASLTYTQAGVQSVLYSVGKFAATPDGAHVVGVNVGTSSGTVVVWNGADDTFASQDFEDGFWSDVAVSPDGNEFAALSAHPSGANYSTGVVIGFFDDQLHYLNANVYPDLAPPDALQSLGAIFSPSGKTLVVPLGDSIDFVDSTKGTLRGRLLTPEPLPVLPQGLVTATIAMDPTAETIYAISTSGLTVLKLPSPVDQLVPPVWPY
jgi:hypothetical protein